jgi:hypothetical protein
VRWPWVRGWRRVQKTALFAHQPVRRPKIAAGGAAYDSPGGVSLPSPPAGVPVARQRTDGDEPVPRRLLRRAGDELRDLGAVLPDHPSAKAELEAQLGPDAYRQLEAAAGVVRAAAERIDRDGGQA